ncbi:hypothetical protein Tco_0644929, partial [Tanacetum coccineum]
MQLRFLDSETKNVPVIKCKMSKAKREMHDKYFVEYTGVEVKQFRDTLLQPMTQAGKVDTGKALDVGLAVIESSETESKLQDISSRSGNGTDTDDADIRPIYDEEPMAE